MLNNTYSYILERLFFFLRYCGFTFVYPFDKDKELVTAYSKSYDDIFYMIMYNDEIRNKAYRAALKESAPNRRVLDIGTGKYVIWGRNALKSGAKRVYSIEANPDTYLNAKKLVSSESKLKLIESFSDEVTLSHLDEERCEVVVQEIIGSIGSAEGALFYINDIKKRLTTDDAIQIPKACTTFFAPVLETELGIFNKFLNRLSYGSPFSKDKESFYLYNYPRNLIIAKDEIFETFDFSTDMQSIQKNAYQFEVNKTGKWAGFLFWIKLDITDNRSLNSLDQITNWPLVYVRASDKPINVTKGTIIEVETEVDLSDFKPKYQISYRVAGTEQSNTLNF